MRNGFPQGTESHDPPVGKYGEPDMCAQCNHVGVHVEFNDGVGSELVPRVECLKEPPEERRSAFTMVACFGDGTPTQKQPKLRTF
jgi:hypothetical protein